MFGFTTSPVKMLKRIHSFNLILSTLGIALSAYAIFVEYKKEVDKNYKALCDFNEYVSCSNVLASKYGKGFGFLAQLVGENNPLVLPNGVYGIVFYLIIIGLGELTATSTAIIQKYVALSSNLMSVYLGYILFFILKDICMLCIATYVINLLITAFCFMRVNHLHRIRNKKKSNKKKRN